MDYIKITGLKIYAYHGVLPEEQKNGQDFIINARLFYSMKKAGMSDDLNDALNYAEVCEFIGKTFTEKRFENMAKKYKEVDKLLQRYKKGKISYATFRDKIKQFRDTNREYQTN